MRTLLATLLALAFLLPTPALGQDPATSNPGLLVEDPAGDVQATFDGNAVPAPGQFTAIDLRSFAIREDPAGFVLDVQVEGLGDGLRPDWGNVQVRLTFDGVLFYVNFNRAQDSAAYFGSVIRVVEGEGYEFVRSIPVDRDLATGHLWLRLERQDLVGAGGQRPGRGDQLTELTVIGSAAAGYMAQPQNQLGAGPWIPTWIGDIMPDDGAAPPVDVQFGGGDGEGASLEADEPFRASNGEATTYLYTLKATHRGDGTARYRVFLEGLPAGWNATLPGALLDLPAGVPVEFPLYVTTTFKHEHGTAAAFQVHLHEQEGAGWAMAELGVDYLAVPQPAGHHPDLWLHSNYFSNAIGAVNEALGGTNGYASMNTLEDDPGDAHVPIVGMSSVGDVDSTTFRWSVCLEPGLRLGLDFDLSRAGAIELPIQTVRPLPGATLGGRLLHLAPGEPLSYCYPGNYADRDATILAELAGTPTEVAANSAATLTAAIQPLEAADYVPAQEGAALVLELELTVAAPGAWGNGGPKLAGGHLQLPLNEYHDALQVTVPGSGEAAAAGFVAEAGDAKDAPALALPLMAAALVALAMLRRRA